MAWAFWAAPLEEVAQSPAAIIELNEMIDTIEEVKKVKFTEGYNPNVECIRLSLDPVIASHRPLIYYTVSQTGCLYGRMRRKNHERVLSNPLLRDLLIDS
jgi:hypothetical protein